MIKSVAILLLFVLNACYAFAQDGFVHVRNGHFERNGRPYYYVGANYWYGGVLGLQHEPKRGIERLRRELDFLHRNGITNLRVMAAAEGSGLVSGVECVGPPLQDTHRHFDTSVLDGLDLLLTELDKRKMTAVLFLSNNWEWSGGFLQYLNWNGLLPDSVMRRRLSWDEQRDLVSRFYSCAACQEDYLRQVSLILHHTNRYNGKRYTDEPSIMAWELANEPRPMRPAADSAYRSWISRTAAFIHSIDPHHLVTTGHEGMIGTESLPLFEQVHADPNIDYLTIHIWPKNWGWFSDTAIQRDWAQVTGKTKEYIDAHRAVAQRLHKPLVIEEFGLPRDQQAFAPGSPTTLRDAYYRLIFSEWKKSADVGGVIGGANFWAFNGMARPKKGQTFWQPGDDYMGDPPMEQQGLNGVFDTDLSTWQVIRSYTRKKL